MLTPWKRALGLILIGSLGSVCQGQTQLGDLFHEIAVDQGDLSTLIGRTVDISQTNVILGARGDSEQAPIAGAAFLFDITTKTVRHKLLASDGAFSKKFGRSVAINGAIAIVGASDNENLGDRAGGAYLFDVETGLEIWKLTPNDPAGDQGFGISVDVQDQIAIVGAYNDNENGANSGAAYIFDVATGAQLHKLIPADPGGPSNLFGWSVAIDGSIAVVGAPYDNVKGVSTGTAYLFDINTGEQIGKLIPGEGDSGDLFGWSVAISADRVLVGAWKIDEGVLYERAGAAYLFSVLDSSLLWKLTPDVQARNDEFGISVALDGNVAIVGCPGHDHGDNESGAAFVFDATTGEQIFKYIQSNGQGRDFLGESVAIDGGSAAAGVPGRGPHGEAHLFRGSPCYADLNNDWKIDTADLGAVLGSFGGNTPPYEFGDINGDGVIDTADLGLLVGSFGANCP